jgi:receptor protein-tyrosine kinase/non-specific protein-tyrosine kinase
MSKVFEALQRQQENEKEKRDNRDPLAAETGTPDSPAGSDGHHETDANYVLPQLIGAPTGPRSNEGMIFPSFETPLEDRNVSLPDTRATNGKINIEAPIHPGRSGHAFSPAARDSQIEGWEEQNKVGEPQPEIKAQKAAPSALSREIRVEHLSKARLHPRLITLTDPHSPECEQYRTLRTELFHAAAKKQIQVVMVTSALAGEGKTSTVLNLAFAIAQSKEKRVLVIDGDMRRPNIASFLGLRPAVGLIETLTRENDVFDSIFSLDEHDLYVLPVKKESNNPTELLSSERLGEMLALLRGYFDFILVDSPPVMPFADARLLAGHADTLILVVRAGLAPYDTVEKAIGALPQGRILGVVLNGAEHAQESGYYDYYYYYSRQERNEQTVRGRITNRFRQIGIGRKTR